MTYKFEAIIQQVENKDATFIEIPFDVEKEFGAKRVKVKAKFDNVDYRGSIVRMGMPCFMIGLTKEITVKKNAPDKNNNEIQALSGATITSNAVSSGANAAIDAVKKIKEAAK